MDESERLGTARGGWAWDVKFGDFDNSGTAEIVQATGFIRGKRDRWPELQEFAMSNDTIIRRPEVWPRFADGDDVSGHEPNAFFVRSSDGRFYDLAKLVGLGRSQVSRGIAIADLEGDGLLDLFFANQWEDSRLYRNRSKDSGSFLGLDLVLPLDEGTRTAVLDGRISHLVDGRAAVGAQVLVKAQGSVQRALVDGGNGHSGRRDPSVHVGLGRARDAGVEIKYRDQHGVVRLLKLLLRPGWHTIVLGEEGE